jgi:hypothetical protein
MRCLQWCWRGLFWLLIVVVAAAAVALLLLARGGGSPQFTDPNALREAAAQEAASALVQQLAPKPRLTTVGLVAFASDREGTVTNAISTALAKAGRWRVKHILVEEGSPDALARAGRVAAVDALLTGKVTEDKVLRQTASLSLEGRLVAVKDGADLWHGEAESSHASAAGKALALETVIERTIDGPSLLRHAQTRVASRIVSAVSKQLPAKLGLAPFAGDANGALGRELASALSGKTEVVTLAGPAPALDSASVSRAGKQGNVPAVLVGQVESSQVFLGRAQLTVHARLVRARDGVILASDTFTQVSQSHVGRYRWLLLAGSSLLLLLLAAFTILRVLRALRRLVPGQARALRERELDTDQRLRERVAREIGTCVAALNRLADRSVAAGQTQQHAAFLALRRDLDQLRLEVESAPFGHHPELERAGVNEQDLRQLADLEQRLLGSLESLAGDLRELAEEKPGSDLEERLGALSHQVADLKHRLQERQSVLAGLE